MKNRKTLKSIVLFLLATLAVAAVFTVSANAAVLKECKISAVLNRPITFSDSGEFATIVNESGVSNSYTAIVTYNASNGKLSLSGSDVVSGKEYTLSQINSFKYTPSKVGSEIVTIDFKNVDVKFYVTLEISKNDSESILYSAVGKNAVVFDGDDFNSASLLLTGSALNYVTFTLPDAKAGKLVYTDGGKTLDATSSAKFYLTGSPKISSISFIPAETVSSPISISYKGWNVKDASFSGTIRIVPNISTTIEMKVSNKGYASLDRELFQNICLGYTGTDLIYVTFTPSESGKGALVYGIESRTSFQYGVDAYRSFYYSASPYLSFVSYIPNANYKNGYDEISFVAHGAHDASVAGTLKINIVETESIAYTLYQGEDKAVNPDDFVKLAKKFTNDPIDYITFSQQKDVSQFGILLYIYKSSSDTVLPEKKYSPTKSLFLEYVTYRPATNFTGVCSFTYTAYTKSEGDKDPTASFGGTVDFTVLPASQKPAETTKQPNDPVSPTPVADPIPADSTASERKEGGSAFFSDVTSSQAWGAGAIDWLHGKGVINGVTTTTYSPSAYIKRGDFILMLYRAYNLKADFTDNFADVAKGSYYYTAIGVAKALGIAQGQGNNKFNPDGYLTRQDALVLVLRTAEKAGVTLPASVALPNFSDKSSISSYAQNAVNTLAKAGVVKGDTAGRINPLQNLSRIEMAVILFRVINLK